MKKQILCTSAIALGVAMAAPASAQDWDVSWGGFAAHGFGYADVNGGLVAGQDRSGIDVFQTSEIIFTPSVTLDNGLTFGLNIQLESFGSVGDQIDESYMTISSDTLGTITIGSENSEGYRHMIGAPVVTSMWINSPSVSSYIPFSLASTGVAGSFGTFRTASISSYTEVGGNNDAERISYRTPNFNGFTLGVSYARDGGQDNFSAATDVNPAGTLHDIFDIGAGYSGSFGGADVSIAGRWGTGSVAGASNAETWAVGLNVGFAGFTIGGSYADNDNPGQLNDSTGWSLGASYDTAGPWSFALSTYQGDGGGGQAHYKAYKLGASRDLGPGVDLDIFAIRVDTENNAGADLDGFVIGTQVNLSF